MSRSIPMRAALLASLVTFAGSIAGFHLTAAGGTPDREALAVDRSAPPEKVALKHDCPEKKVRRLWEEA